MSLSASVNPAPLSPAQTWALVAAATRELTWGLRAVSRETARWRALAETIPDRQIRDDALHALTHKRGHTDGAALFTILPRKREPGLLRLLVTYETMVDYLDNVSERHPSHANGQQLHRALIDALDPDRPLADYYRFHPWSDDAGYLAALVTVCQDGCRALPSFTRVRELLRRETQRALVAGLNHEPDPAARECPDEGELSWFELSGAASATLVILGLLTLAAKRNVTAREVRATYDALWPWSGFATTMLDSFADQLDDQEAGNHSYIAHYQDPDTAIRRTRYAIERTFQAASELPRCHRHTLIVGCMVALYLSKPSASDPRLRTSTRVLAEAGGSLVKVLLPMLRAWRRVYAQRG
jgi:tetraprenyl-beta-curcumene synthase